MADIYVRSTDGSDSDSGATWALAKATATGAAAIDAAGDNIFLSQSHAESTAAAITLALAGTMAAPSKLICVNDAAEPPNTPATGAIIGTTGASNIVISGLAAHVQGITFEAGSAGSQAVFQYAVDAGLVSMKDCNIRLTNSSVNSRINFGGSSSNSNTRGILENLKVRFGNASQLVQFANGSYDVKGGTIESGGTSPTSAFLLASSAVVLNVDGFDFSAASAGMNIFGASSAAGKCVVRNSKLPVSWSGSLAVSLPTTHDCRIELHNCTDGTNDYLFQSADYAGTIKDDRAVTCTGGANDGSGYSFKLVSSANTSFPAVTLDTPEFSAWNTSTSAVTATVEIVRDSATPLTDGEIWLEVSYIGASGQAFATDAKASILATAADQATSTASWTTTGLSAPLKQKLSVTFTPAEAGFIQAKVRLAKPGSVTTVYVDPKLTVA